MNKRILIVCRQAPYGSSLAREAIDLALATSVFEQELALLFLGDGVLQLLKHQASNQLNLKNHGNVLSAFPLYDINALYIDQQALEERQLQADELLLTTTSLEPDELPAFIEQYDIVLNF